MGTVTNIKVQPMTVTWGASAIGFTDGDLSFATEEKVVEVTAHEEGTNVLTAIRTGKSAEIAMVIKETTPALVQYLYAQGGLLATASGAASAIIGWGNNKDFTQVTAQAAKLVLHPVVKASADLSEDIAAWKAYPMVESFDFSGENPSTIALTFKIYPDLTKAASLRLFVIGDHTDGTFTEIE